MVPAGRSLPLIESTNALALSTFIEKYLIPLGSQSFETENEQYTITLESISSISAPDLEACFNLIKFTSETDYRNSSMGWSAARKKREMKLPDMKYLLVRPVAVTAVTSDPSSGPASSSPSSPPTIFSPPSSTKSKPNPPPTPTPNPIPPIKAFLSLMPTYENALPVIYIYEIHIPPPLRHHGLGRKLITIVENLGSRIGVEKAMLTVFKANGAARRFYRGLGWEVDGFSPVAKGLRGGRGREVDYEIWSKALRKDSG